MGMGPIKTGNDYNFRPENIRLRANETRDDIAKLNKIEIRYNTRTNEPSYPAMKSLYKWRSVFGYRLGGAIRQGIVKLAEVKRHVINIHSFYSATVDPHEDYARKYSARDVISAIKGEGTGPTGALKYLKYRKWDEFHEDSHDAAHRNDMSLRNMVTTGVSNLAKAKQKDGVQQYWQMRLDQATRTNAPQEEIAEIRRNMKEALRLDRNEVGLRRVIKGNIGRLTAPITDSVALKKVSFRLKHTLHSIKSAFQEVRELRQTRGARMLNADTMREREKIMKESAFKLFVAELSDNLSSFSSSYRRKYGSMVEKTDYKAQTREQVEKLGLEQPLDTRSTIDPETGFDIEQLPVEVVGDHPDGPSLRDMLGKISFNSDGTATPLKPKTE